MWRGWTCTKIRFGGEWHGWRIGPQIATPGDYKFWGPAPYYLVRLDNEASSALGTKVLAVNVLAIRQYNGR